MMQTLQQTATKYYEAIPADWKKESLSQFPFRFAIITLITGDLKRGLKGGVLAIGAEAICQLATPLFKKIGSSPSIVFILTIRNLALFTSIKSTFEKSIQSTLLTTAFTIMELVTKPYITQENFSLFPHFTTSFINATTFFETETALKASLLSTGAKCLFQKSYSHMNSPNSASTQETRIDRWARFILDLSAMSFTLSYDRPIYQQALLILPNLILAFNLKKIERLVLAKVGCYNVDELKTTLKLGIKVAKKDHPQFEWVINPYEDIIDSIVG